MEFIPGQHIHFVGIGGSGLSPIARILLERGYKISGSDRATNAMTDALARDGATIYQGHDAAHINGADMLIITSAVQTNAEIEAAQAAGIPVYKRKDMMSALMTGKKVIAVAGTAGKTTTTALVTHLLREGGKNPSYIVGGILANTGTNAGNGSDDAFVIEADEYDNMFHGLRPNIALITNIDYDHPDFFKTEAEMFDSFRVFAEQVEGIVLLCIDNLGAKRLYQELLQAGKKVYSYGLSENADYRASNIRVEADGSTTFEINFAGGSNSIRSPLPGNHNVQNVLGAAVIAHQFCDVSFEAIAQAVATFQGTGRRFELLGEVDGITVIDDYAHHPAKIRATLQAARSRYPDHEIWAVWQPHTYSRTQTLMADFAASFDDADHVIVTEIYAARENPLPGVDGKTVTETITAQQKHKSVNFSATLDNSITLLLTKVTKPAIIVVMSAGDASRIGYDYLLKRRSSS